MLIKHLISAFLLISISENAAIARTSENHLEKKFVVLGVFPVKFKRVGKDLCQIDLQEDVKSGTKPSIYKASASSVICDLKKGSVVELGIHTPHCDIIWSEEHPPGSADQVACTTGRDWFVMTYTHMQDGEQITSIGTMTTKSILTK